jgi:prephenate dehydratase
MKCGQDPDQNCGRLPGLSSTAGAIDHPHMRRVAFQGELGAFSEEAITRYWSGEAEPVPMRHNRDVARAVAEARVDFGMLPVENTLAGSVAPSYDALAETPEVFVVGELALPIHHCLLAPKGAELTELRRVESHPVALDQCALFLQRHPHIVAHAAYDTAGAAREASLAGDRTRAAIAGRAAAARYGLAIVADGIQDRNDNQTRFVVLSKDATPARGGVPTRMMLMLTTANVPGALSKVLVPLAERGINLTKIESRPTGEPWTYRFFLELEHSGASRDAEEAMEAVQRAARSVRIIGAY